MDESLYDGILSSGVISLLVLSGSDDQTLLLGQHPVRSDPRVQMDVHLVCTENHLSWAGLSHHAPLAARRFPKASDHAPGTSPTHAHLLKHKPDMTRRESSARGSGSGFV